MDAIVVSYRCQHCGKLCPSGAIFSLGGTTAFCRRCFKFNMERAARVYGTTAEQLLNNKFDEAVEVGLMIREVL